MRWGGFVAAEDVPRPEGDKITRSSNRQAHRSRADRVRIAPSRQERVVAWRGMTSALRGAELLREATATRSNRYALGWTASRHETSCPVRPRSRLSTNHGDRPPCIHDSQAKPRPFALFLLREEGLEEMAMSSFEMRCPSWCSACAKKRRSRSSRTPHPDRRHRIG